MAVFHGFTSTTASVSSLATALQDAGYEVDCPTLPGHGTDWQDLEKTSRETILRAGLASYDRLAARCRHVAVAGLSMGGALALHVAAHRRVFAAVVINPALRLKPLTGRAAGMLAPLCRTLPGIAGDIAKPGISEQAYARVPLRSVFQLDRMMAQVRSELDEVTSPLLMLRSARDNILPPASADTLVRQFGPGQLTEVELSDSLHVATLDYDAEKVIDLSTDFLSRCLHRGDSSPPGHNTTEMT